MSLKSLLTYCCVTGILLAAWTIESVENSIIPKMEKFECYENLPIYKYSDNQLVEIGSALKRKAEMIRVVTYNLLFDIYDHNQEEVNRWPQRLPRITALIEEMQPDIICVQEPYLNQCEDLLARIEQTYAFYARSCDQGELNGIFYRKERFKLITSSVLSMTSSPEIPSADQLTMVQLEDLTTGYPIAIFNTHLSFSNVNKRDFQARFIAKHLETTAQQMPVIFTGDLNTFPNRLDLEKLPFYDGDNVHRILTQGSMINARDKSLLGHLGPISTFSNEGESPIPFRGNGTPGVFLDHLYVSKKVNVVLHAVQAGTVDGHYPSDHLPVLMDCLIEQ